MNNEELLADKNRIQEEILKIESAINQGRQQLDQMQVQLIRHQGALDYITDNIKEEKCTEET